MSKSQRFVAILGFVAGAIAVVVAGCHGPPVEPKDNCKPFRFIDSTRVDSVVLTAKVCVR